ncbi:MAG: PA0069 family radical SAM protein [Planctomycetota bacterium]
MSESPDYVDALPDGLAHRRGAGINPGNRFEANRFHLDGDYRDWLEAERDNDGRLRKVPLQVLADDTRTVINRVTPTSDVPFDWTLNPYRGCEHGCVYCFARPYHEFLGMSCGLDFETKIVAKHDAAELLRRELAHPRWKPEPIVMSAITDIYQPIEAKLGLARQCLEVLADAGQPVTTMTKGSLVLRDVDLWARLAEKNAGRVTVTIVTLDDTLAKQLEPRAASPSQRLRVIRELTKAGIPVSVNVAPVIPGLTDAGVPEILEAVADAGARQVRWTMLRLPYQLKAVFLDWLERNVHADRAKKVQSKLRQLHGGKLYQAGNKRRRGRGPLSQSIASTFDIFTRKHGLNRDIRPMSVKHFRRPELHGQMSLF